MIRETEDRAKALADEIDRLKRVSHRWRTWPLYVVLAIGGAALFEILKGLFS
jgi:hypothetical protein